MTIEALAPVLQENPRGVLVARDELAAWLRSFNQYKSKGGSDAAAWLELWRAGTLIVDRKTGLRRIYVPRAAVSVCGTIQPGTLAVAMTPEHFESGLAARLLIVRPPERLKQWSERSPSAHVVRDYERVIADLLNLQHEPGRFGPEPVALPLAADARPLWAAWYNDHAKRIANAETDRESAALAKLEAYGARFALMFTLIDHPSAAAVTSDAVRRGTALADWFADEAGRVYSALAESDDDSRRRNLAEWIGRRGGIVTVRDLTHNLGRCREPGFRWWRQVIFG